MPKAVAKEFPDIEYFDIAVKVIDDRGNELMVVKNLSEAETAKT